MFHNQFVILPHSEWRGFGKVNREYHECLLISSLSGEDQNSVGMAMLAKPVRRVFQVKPDKLDIKSHLRGFLFIKHY